MLWVEKLGMVHILKLHLKLAVSGSKTTEEIVESIALYVVWSPLFAF